MDSLKAKYDYINGEAADPRALIYPGMASPWPTLIIIALYLVSIYKILPTYMKNRRAYALTTYLYYYNIFQIITCAFIIYGMITSGWTTHYSWVCQPVDYSDDSSALRMLRFFYYTYLLKGAELTETLIFVLRKKYNQVSFLHVYHHASTFLFIWLGTKYVGGGMASMPILINSFVHILMYTYYLLSSLGPEWQKIASKWKSTLTFVQIVQLCVVTIYTFLVLKPGCPLPRLAVVFFAPNVILVLYMFWQFYKKSYLQKEKKAT